MIVYGELHTFGELRIQFEYLGGMYLTQSVFQFVLRKSIPIHIRHLILYISKSKEYVDGFVVELTSAKRL